MRILMIGWEYPPHISGGLGTACEGLTTALARLGVDIDFVVPRAWGDEDAGHMRLLGVSGPASEPEPAHAAPSGGEDAVESRAEPDADPNPAAASTSADTRVDDGQPATDEAAEPAPDASAAAATRDADAQGRATSESGTDAGGAPGATGPRDPDDGDVARPGGGPEREAADDEISPESRAEPSREPRTWRIPAHLRPYLSAADFEALRSAGLVGDGLGAEHPSRDAGGGAGTDAEPDRAVIEHVAASLVAAGLPHLAPRPSMPSDRDGGRADHPDDGISASSPPAGAHYGDDLFGEVARYAARVSALAARCDFDLIHAHDWMTWPAAIAVARQSGAPLIAHVHSLEHDRSGAHPDVRIDAVERAGLAAADLVICVSHYTAGIVNERYGVPTDRLRVVHNGVYAPAVVRDYRRPRRSSGPLVLFLGRITFQKGPDYFVEAAARVARHMPDVTFVVAGSGDMVPGLERRVADLGLADRFRFPGFLRGAEVERMFSLADLYVMPSVSEPFGIAPLEAMSYDTPVIVSKQSGVSEVLNHALKVDFWDVERMADLMLGALRYPELRQEIVDMARDEVRRIHWDAAAEKCLRIYHETVAADR